MGTELIPIAIVEDHPLYRRGLTQTATQSDALTLVAAAASLEELDASDLTSSSVVILDLHLPGVEGPDAVRLVRSSGPAVLVLSASESPTEVIEAIGAGAAGYLTKSADTEEIIQAIASCRTVGRTSPRSSPGICSTSSEEGGAISARTDSS